MKISMSKIDRLELNREARKSNSALYDVCSPRGVLTFIDDDENFVDALPRTVLRYTIDEAEALVEFMHKAFPDYKSDPYYGQGIPIYPIYSNINSKQITPENKHHFTRSITVYRYQMAGEWVYGITNKWSDEGEPYRAAEAPMDGWEKWLVDRKQMLIDRWMAAHGMNL